MTQKGSPSPVAKISIVPRGAAGGLIWSRLPFTATFAVV